MPDLFSQREDMTSAEYQKQLFEQYKIYIDLADKISRHIRRLLL